MRDQLVYSKEFKVQAVEMALQPEANKAGVARSLGDYCHYFSILVKEI